jgi:hypothetical protein
MNDHRMELGENLGKKGDAPAPKDHQKVTKFVSQVFTSSLKPLALELLYPYA